MDEFNAGKTPDDIKQQNVWISGLLTAMCLISALLAIIGGIRMLQLRSYGLVMIASLVTAVPCLSPSACCLLGEIVGLWAIVVLISPVTRAAFR
jgi:hypothetical protein